MTCIHKSRLSYQRYSYQLLTDGLACLSKSISCTVHIYCAKLGVDNYFIFYVSSEVSLVMPFFYPPKTNILFGTYFLALLSKGIHINSIMQHCISIVLL